MKKLFALMMAVALMLTAMSSALAYTAVTPAENQPAITHTLKLSDPEATGLAYEITYTFTVEQTPTVMQPADVFDADYAVTGSPKIAPITYNSASTFSADNKSCTQPLKIDWSGVMINEPGVYRWQVNKTCTDTDTSADPTNKSTTMYLYAYAIDNGGTLTIESVGMTSAADLDDKNAKSNLGDEYPAKTIDLSISKTVSGNQGSKNQYFLFTVSLTAPAGAATKTYSISGLDATVPATAYHESKTNVAQVVLTGGTAADVSLWLKHGQTAEIKDLLYGTAYTITESANTGYTVKNKTTINNITGEEMDGAEVTSVGMEASTTVAFTNTKNATVPTGIELHTSAAIMGILLAAGLMMLMLIGKRKAVTE